MKLTLTMVRDDDADEVVEALTQHGYYVTRLASTGGFLRAGYTVLLSGVEDDQVDPMLQVLEAHTEVRVSPPSSLRLQEDVQVSRAVVFVLQLERLAKL